jgi:hypothetical protein
MNILLYKHTHPRSTAGRMPSNTRQAVNIVGDTYLHQSSSSQAIGILHAWQGQACDYTVHVAWIFAQLALAKCGASLLASWSSWRIPT